MSVNWATLYQGVLTGTAASIFAPGTALQAAIHAANVWNPTTGALTLNLYIVPTGGTANDTGAGVDWVERDNLPDLLQGEVVPFRQDLITRLQGPEEEEEE